jgi:hypothetical protein
MGRKADSAGREVRKQDRQRVTQTMLESTMEADIFRFSKFVMDKEGENAGGRKFV